MLEFSATEIGGVTLVKSSAFQDERGSFSRLYCPVEFADAGLTFASTQVNLSSNRLKHTLRGMHFQQQPFAEAKFVRVLRGAIYDVVADMRAESPTAGRWQSFELSRTNQLGLMIPEGCAHGFMTLEDECDVLYQMGRPHAPGHAAGFRYDDPDFAIVWPAAPVCISPADLAWPPLRAASPCPQRIQRQLDGTRHRSLVPQVLTRAAGFAPGSGVEYRFPCHRPGVPAR